MCWIGKTISLFVAVGLVVFATFPMLISPAAAEYAGLLDAQVAPSVQACPVAYHLEGDINGDKAVNIIDIAHLAVAWGSTSGSDNWDPCADFDGNGVINIVDAATFAQHFRMLAA